MKSKDKKAVVKALTAAGYTVVSVEESGKHPKVILTDGKRTVQYPIANSASDVHWVKQVVRKVKRVFSEEYAY